MYVRWRKRNQTKSGRPTGRQYMTAVLVKSERSGERVHQRHIADLGSIVDTQDQVQRRQFWTHAAKAIDRLALDQGQRAKIEADLLAHVSRPSEPEAAPVRARWDLSAYKKAHGLE